MQSVALQSEIFIRFSGVAQRTREASKERKLVYRLFRAWAQWCLTPLRPSFLSAQQELSLLCTSGRSRRLWFVNERLGFEVFLTSVHVFRAVVVHRAADGDGAARAALIT